MVHGGVAVFVFGWWQHIQRRVAALLVMEGIDVVSRRRAQFENRCPFSPVPQLSLHPGPERLDHGIVITIANSSEAEPQPVFVDIAGERPGLELGDPRSE